jgi:hypothetical protein
MFVGDQPKCAVNELVNAFDRACYYRRPQMVVLNAETGLGKTRILQEFYARLAAERQGTPRYWPDRIDSVLSGDVLRDRKRIVPAGPFTIAGGAPINYVWWGILCQDSEDGVAIPRLSDSARQLDTHAQHLTDAKADHVDTALTLMQDVISVVGLANPIQLALKSMDVAKTSASYFQRVRRKIKAPQALSGDRTVDIDSMTDDARINALVNAVRNASNAGLPVVIVVDDAHNADPSLISFLRQLSQMESGAVLVVVAAWPSRLRHRMDGTAGSIGAFLESATTVLAGRSVAINVEKLTRDDVGQLILEAAPKTSVSMIDRFCDVIDGNPLLFRLYLSLDVIQRDISDGALDTDPAVFGTLPRNAKGVWQELWSQLPGSAQLALAIVSLQGSDFHPGFLERAAMDLDEFDVFRVGLGEAEKTYGWIGRGAEDLDSFTERLRYQVAYDNQVEQLSASQLAVVYKALAAHTCEAKASDEWLQVPVATRRTMLRSHLAAIRADPRATTPAAAADSAYQLSVLEDEAGDEQAARAAIAAAVEFAEDAGPAMATHLVDYQAYLGLLERDLGNESAAFEAMNAAEVLSREVLGENHEATAALRNEVAELAIAAEVVDDVREDAQPWVGWEPRSAPGIFDESLAVMAELIGEIAAAEGPVVALRIYRYLARAAGKNHAGRAMQDQVDRAISAGVRRRILQMVSPYKGCSAGERIVAVAGSPLVTLRSRGDRELDEVPLTELARAAEQIVADKPDATSQEISRAVMAMYDAKRLTDHVAGLMKRAIQIARRDREKVTTQNANWDRMYRAIAAIPSGRWTSIGDLAELADTSSGWAGRHLFGKWDLENLHRVLEADGQPWRWFQWPAEADRGDVAAVLRGEAAIDTGKSFGDPYKRLKCADLKALIDPTPSSGWAPPSVGTESSAGESRTSPLAAKPK